MQPEEDPEKLGRESAYEGATEMKRRIHRGDESKGDPDERDVAGDYAGDDPQTTDTAHDQGLKDAPFQADVFGIPERGGLQPIRK